MHPSGVPLSPLGGTTSSVSCTSTVPAESSYVPPQIHNNAATGVPGAAATASVTHDYGRLGMAEFNGTEPWKGWRQKLSIVLKLRNIPDDKKVSALLSLLSTKLLSETIAQLGKDWETKTYQEVIACLDKRFDQSKLAMTRRFEFMTRTESGEGPVQFLRNLHEALSNCEFDKVKDPAEFMLVMAFITGVRDTGLRYLLLKEVDLTPKKAEKITLNYVSITEGAHVIGSSGTILKPAIHALEGVTCYSCHGTGHVRKDCPNERRNERTGSDASRRRSKRRRSVNNVTVLPVDDGFPLRLHHISLTKVGLKLGNQHRVPKRSPPSLISAVINDQHVLLELDCGAQISVLGERAWRQLGQPAVVPVSPVESYGASVHMIGKARVVMSLAGRAAVVVLAVAAGMNRENLLGRDLIDLFGLDMGPYYKPGTTVMMSEALISEVEAGSAGEKQKSTMSKSVVVSKRPVSPTLRRLQVAPPDTQKITAAAVGSSEVPSAYSIDEAGTTSSGDLRGVLTWLEAMSASRGYRWELAEANLAWVAESKPRLHTPKTISATLQEAKLARDARNPVDWAEWAAHKEVPKSGGKVWWGIKMATSSRLEAARKPVPVLDMTIGATRFVIQADAQHDVPWRLQSWTLVAGSTPGVIAKSTQLSNVALASSVVLLETMLAGWEGSTVDRDDKVARPSVEKHLGRRAQVLGRVQATKSIEGEPAEKVSRKETGRIGDALGECAAGEKDRRRATMMTTTTMTKLPDTTAKTERVPLPGIAPQQIAGGMAVSARGRSETIFHGSLRNHQQLKWLTGGLRNDWQRPSGGRTTTVDVGYMKLKIGDVIKRTTSGHKR